MTSELVVRRAALDEIDRVIAGIVEQPEACPRWKPRYPYRRARAHRFPYIVFYEVTGNRVVVMAVAHARRRPGYWLRRPSP